MTTFTRAIAALTLLAGCYNPDLSRVRYTCDPVNPFCPDGLQCVNGWCGGALDAPDQVTTAADMATTATPDFALDCSMCVSGACKRLSGTVVGCFSDPLRPISAQCRGNYTIPQQMPFPTDRDCLFIDPTGTRWLGYLRGWNDREPYYAGTAKPWWNGQPSAGITHRFVSMCGSGADSAWPEQVGYTRVIRCNSGLAGEPSSPVRCPRGATPSDADWDMVTAEASVGVMCVQR